MPKTKSLTAKSRPKVEANWRTLLSQLDINTTHSSRTCEVTLMSELTTKYSNIITNFNYTAINEPENPCKSISYTSFINGIKEVAESKESKYKINPSNSIHKKAASEALPYLNDEQNLPIELTAQLIKFHMIQLIFEDVTSEIERKKNENKQPKENSGNKGKSSVNKKSKIENISIESRKLYFVINGFVDPELIEQLSNVGITLTAVLEIAKLNETLEERRCSDVYANVSFSTISLSLDGSSDDLAIFVNKEMSSNASLFVSTFTSEQNLRTQRLSNQYKNNTLYKFWDYVYRLLEGDLRAPFLENTVHIRMPFSCDNLLLDDTTEEYSKQALSIFSKIANELQKLNDITKKHVHYLSNVKIYKIDDDPIEKSVDKLTIYNQLLNSIPPDCYTIEILLYCLVEEICAGEEYENNTDIEKLDQSSTNVQKNSLTNDADLIKSYKQSSVRIIDRPATMEKCNTDYATEKSEDIAKYIIDRRKTNWPRYRTEKLLHQLPKAKINLKISNKPFVTHEKDELSLKLNCYQQILPKLLQINLDFLKASYPSLLWQQCPRIENIESVLKNQQLQTWCNLLNLSESDLKCAINALIFDTHFCTASNSYYSTTRNSLYENFLPKNEENQIKNLEVQVTGMQTPQACRTEELDIESETEKSSVICVSNVYEHKNIYTFKWYEVLTPVVMLQVLKKASEDYTCVDHKFCPFDDTILLRYHNNTDAFGINVQVWNQSIRTPVCIRDFCKYILHEEGEWLRKQVVKESKPITNVVTDEKLLKERSKQIENVLHKNNLLSLCAKPNDPYTFLAYDISETRMQLTGGTTTFHSLDAYKVVIDKTSFIGSPNNISLNVSIKENTFILHCNETSPRKPLLLHFNLAEDIIVAFEKPNENRKQKVNIVEKSYKHFKGNKRLSSNSAYQKREKFYYVLETHRCVIKDIGLMFTTKSDSILSESFIQPCLCDSARLSHCRIGKQENRGASNDLKFQRVTSTDRSLSVNEDLEKYKLNLTNIPKTKRRSCSLTKKQIKERDLVLKQIRKAKKYQKPYYVVVSGKLHKFEYMKRKKSKIRLHLKQYVIELPCKHPTYKVSKHLELLNVFPLKLNENVFTKENNSYNMIMSLPSGLMISRESLLFKQGYIDKGPQCKNIPHEYSRTFTRDGNVVIKYIDGNIKILCKDGVSIHCKIPYTSTITKVKHYLSNKNKFDGSDIQNKYVKKTRRLLSRWYRHLIEGPEANYYKRRRTFKHPIKQNRVYILQRNQLEFTIITADGKKLNVTKNGTKPKDNIFKTIHVDNKNNEELHIRDDGTKLLLNNNGIITTQFRDQTRISSWFTDSSKLLYFEDEDSASEKSMKSGSFQSFEYFLPINDKLNFEGWIIVEMFYKFEHPNYSTIVYNNLNLNSEIFLPNGMSMTTTDKGHYLINMDKSTFACVNNECVYLETSCDTCTQRSTITVNVKPLYDEVSSIPKDTELLRAYDSYDKIFFASYDGSCYRNANFTRKASNSVGCKNHQQKETQKLFVLNRDFSGKKFWDIKTFNKRTAEANKSESTTFQHYNKNSSENCNYTSLEIRTYEFKPLHEKYLLPYCIPDISLLKYVPKSNPVPVAYTKTLQLYCMPEVSLLLPFQETIFDICSKEVGTPRNSGPDICKFINNLIQQHKCLGRKDSVSEVCRSSGDFTSALSQCKKWYQQYFLKQSDEVLKTNSLCRCNVATESETSVKEYTSTIILNGDSIESIPRGSSAYQIQPGVYCQCYKPARFQCDCKRKTEHVMSARTASSEEIFTYAKEEASICGCPKFCSKESSSSEEVDKFKKKSFKQLNDLSENSQEWSASMKMLQKKIVNIVMNSLDAVYFSTQDNKSYKIKSVADIIFTLIKADLNVMQINKLLKILEKDYYKRNGNCEELSQAMMLDISLCLKDTYTDFK